VLSGFDPSGAGHFARSPWIAIRLTAMVKRQNAQPGWIVDLLGGGQYFDDAIRSCGKKSLPGARRFFPNSRCRTARGWFQIRNQIGQILRVHRLFKSLRHQGKAGGADFRDFAAQNLFLDAAGCTSVSDVALSALTTPTSERSSLVSYHKRGNAVQRRHWDPDREQQIARRFIRQSARLGPTAFPWPLSAWQGVQFFQREVCLCRYRHST